MADNTITLTTLQATEMLAAFSALDGYEQPTANGSIFRSYVLRGRIAYAIARNVDILRPIAETFEKTKKACVKKHSGGKNQIHEVLPDGSVNPTYDACMTEIEEMHSAKQEVSLVKIDYDELKADDANNFPPSVIRALRPILTMVDDNDSDNKQA